MRLEKQDAKIILKPGESLDPQALREAVRKADFKPQKIHITARGELTEQSASLILKITDTGQLFLLVQSLSDKNQESRKNSPFTQLQEDFKNGPKRVSVSGEVSGDNQQQLKLMVEEYEIID